MLKVGLTGSIGSGKTLVAKIFETLGTEVFYADAESKLLLQEPEVKAEITRYFGDQILDESSQIVNKRLAAIVFNHPPSLMQLNTIIHPRIKQRVRHWFESMPSSPYAIQEAAILFESGFNQDCDAIITVSAPREVRIQRVMTRDKVSRDEVLLRMKNQWNDEVKSERADYVIINDEKHMVIPQVLHIHEQLLSKSKSKEPILKIKS